MSRIHTAVVAACSAAIIGSSCAELRVTRTASVGGDVYLVMANGDTKRGAGRTVYLVRDTDSLQARIGALCEVYRAATAKTTARANAIPREILSAHADRIVELAQEAGDLDRAQTSRTAALRDSIDLAMLSGAVDTVGTGVAAKYRFAAVPPGRYLIFGEFAIGDHPYRWVAPVTLAAGDSIRRDLDNSVEASERLFCGPAR